MKLIERSTYLSEMMELVDAPDIKVITGVRRSGKSKLMEALAKKILERVLLFTGGKVSDDMTILATCIWEK